MRRTVQAMRAEIDVIAEPGGEGLHGRETSGLRRRCDAREVSTHLSAHWVFAGTCTASAVRQLRELAYSQIDRSVFEGSKGDELSKFHVSQIETHVRGLYEATEWDGSLAEVNNLSRVLALHAVQLVFGELAEGSQIVEITDGEADRGIDAIGVDPAAKLVVMVQA